MCNEARCLVYIDQPSPFMYRFGIMTDKTLALRRSHVLQETKGIFKDCPMDYVAMRKDTNTGSRDYTPPTPSTGLPSNDKS